LNEARFLKFGLQPGNPDYECVRSDWNIAAGYLRNYHAPCSSFRTL